jgi:TRAP transporter 4TM/12TM fusion protein
MSEKEQSQQVDTRLTQGIRTFLYLMAILFSLFHLYIAGVGLVSIERARHIHLMMSMVLIFLFYPLTEQSWRRPGFYLDLLFACLAVTVGLYLEIEHMKILTRIGELNTLDVIMGSIAVFLTMEICRRIVGWPLVLTVLAFMVYDHFGGYIPGHFGHKGHTWSIMINTFYPQVRGIYGVPLGVVVKFVVLFIVFGAFLQKTGAGDFFVRAAFAITGQARGGPAKTAVVASAMMGSISGSPTANIVTTGSFTIPMMKKIGYPAHMAGGVEVAASTGGTLMPPIMGAAAFLIVALTGIPYVEIMRAAIIPSLLYLFSRSFGAEYTT